MTPTQLKDLFRSDVRDEASPPLWTDTEIFVYMDDAQKMFCREGGGIADSTSTICTMQVVAGDTYIDYDETKIYGDYAIDQITQHVIGRHLVQHLAQRSVTVAGDVLVDARMHDTTRQVRGSNPKTRSSCTSTGGTPSSMPARRRTSMPASISGAAAW